MLLLLLLLQNTSSTNFSVLLLLLLLLLLLQSNAQTENHSCVFVSGLCIVYSVSFGLEMVLARCDPNWNLAE